MHYPAHESLQEFAKRTGRTVAAAYDDWHNRPYPEARVTRLREVFDDITGRRSLGFLKAGPRADLASALDVTRGTLHPAGLGEPRRRG